MRTALVGGRVLLDNGFVEGVGVVIDGARIAAVLPERDLPGDIAREDLGGGALVPGFIDTQVNGGGGALFNEAPTVETIATIGAAHRAFGTTGFLPTLISDDIDVVRAGMTAVDAAIEAGVPGVLGIHIEGPFISATRRGIHRADKIARLDRDGFEILTRLKQGRTLVTLAPERTTPTMIARLVGAGVIVAAGHTNGTYRAIRAGLDAGITGFTHLFNAMSPLTSRAPGAVGAALEEDNAYCGIIVDGHHVDPVTLRLALRCKPLDRFMLVTDAMPSVGIAEKGFELQGQAITVARGKCVTSAGTLAGSDLDMASAIGNAVRLLGIDFIDAARMASLNPAKFLGLAGQYGRIAVGYRASLTLMRDRGDVARTWIDGRLEE